MDAKAKWRAEDFTGYPGGRLTLPTNYEVGARLIFELLHCGICVQNRSGFNSSEFIAGAHTLERSGWPVETTATQNELYVSWRDDVDQDVLAAWCHAYGTRLHGDLVDCAWEKQRHEIQARQGLRKYS